MEALFASCSEEFQNVWNSRAQVVSTVEGLKSEILAYNQQLRLGRSINQQLQDLERRISILEARPTG
eukprot:4430626-Alexandrium_andersonii.AAC.1